MSVIRGIRRYQRNTRGGVGWRARAARAVFAAALAGCAGMGAASSGQEATTAGTPIGRTAFAIPLSGITIDGKLDDWPDDMVAYLPRLNTNVYGSTDLSGTDLDASTDFSPSFRVGYNLREQRIYVAQQFRDDRVQVAQGNVRATDAGEINLGSAGNTPPYCYSLTPPGGGYFEAGNPGVYSDNLDDELAATSIGVEAVFGREGDISVYEWSLPVLGASPDEAIPIAPGMDLPFDVVAVDNDGPGDTSAWITWNPNRAKHQLINVGRLVLAEAALGAVEVRTTVGDMPLGGVPFEVIHKGRKLLVDVTDETGIGPNPCRPARIPSRRSPRGTRDSRSKSI